MKTAEITLDNLKDADGWAGLSWKLGLWNEVSEIFEFGEYASITIEVDEHLNIVSGKINRFKEKK